MKEEYNEHMLRCLPMESIYLLANSIRPDNDDIVFGSSIPEQVSLIEDTIGHLRGCTNVEWVSEDMEHAINKITHFINYNILDDGWAVLLDKYPIRNNSRLLKNIGLYDKEWVTFKSIIDNINRPSNLPVGNSYVDQFVKQFNYISKCVLKIVNEKDGTVDFIIERPIDRFTITFTIIFRQDATGFIGNLINFESKGYTNYDGNNTAFFDLGLILYYLGIYLDNYKFNQ